MSWAGRRSLRGAGCAGRKGAATPRLAGHRAAREVGSRPREKFQKSRKFPENQREKPEGQPEGLLTGPSNNKSKGGSLFHDFHPLPKGEFLLLLLLLPGVRRARVLRT